jgi:hypothetical protein
MRKVDRVLLLEEIKAAEKEELAGKKEEKANTTENSGFHFCLF